MTPTTCERTDLELLERYRQGDQDAAAAIYRRYSGRLRAMIRRRCSRVLSSRVEPDDILQSTFGSFFRRASETTSIDGLWGLMLIICLHKIHDMADYHLAARRDARRVAAGGFQDSRVLEPAAMDEVVLRELTVVIEDLLSRLSKQDSLMIRLRIQGYEVAEIATRTSRSKRTVERVLSHFRQTLDSLIRDN